MTFGQVCILVAFFVTLFSIGISVCALRSRSTALVRSLKRANYAVCALLSLSIARLAYLLLTRRFDFKYVFEYSERAQSPFYTFSALWAGQEGSILIWAWLLALFGTIMMIRLRSFERYFAPAQLVVSATLVPFLILLIVFTDPFVRLHPAPPDGFGMNPLLRNIGMVFHPPTLYLGFVGFTIPFALMIAGLWRGETEEWWKLSRPWTLFSWIFLTIGIILGMQWAYVELGWGGYWGWDPVENASLIPWLTATAFLHGTVLYGYRKMLKTWSMILLIATFELCIFGTYLTRSGVIQSVHAFGKSPFGNVFLVFMIIVLIVSIPLLVSRRKKMGQAPDLESYFSLDAAIYLLHLILLVMAFIVLFGTTMPVWTTWVFGEQRGVTPEFFTRVNRPFGLALLFLVSACSVLAWRRDNRRDFLKKYAPALLVAAAGAALLWMAGYSEPLPLSTGFLAFLGLTTTAPQLIRQIRNGRKAAACIAHIGVILLILGIVFSGTYKTEYTATLRKGETAEAGGYTFLHRGFTVLQLGGLHRVIANLDLEFDGRTLGRVRPEKQFHRESEQPITEVAIRPGLGSDLYVILAGYDLNDGETAELIVQRHPLISLIWLGGILMALGGVVSLFSTSSKIRKYRVPQPV